MFEKLTTDGMEQQEDRLGGFSLLESGLYDGAIKMAYISESSSDDSGAKALNIILEFPDHDMNTRIWFLNRKGEHFSEKNGKKIPMYGFDLVNSMALMATGQPFAEQTFEEKTINIWDYDAKKELPQSVTVATSLLTKPITVGVLKQTVNKTKLNESTGNYEDLAETRDENVADKFFHSETKRTVAEVLKGGDIADEDLFYTKWGDKNTGVTRNRAKEVKGSSGAAPAGGTGKPAKSKNLFGN